MKWIMLLIAGMTEVTWAVAMKAAEGFTKTVPSVITVVGYVLSAVFLSMALKELPLLTSMRHLKDRTFPKLNLRKSQKTPRLKRKLNDMGADYQSRNWLKSL